MYVLFEEKKFLRIFMVIFWIRLNLNKFEQKKLFNWRHSLYYHKLIKLIEFQKLK